jgi:hypothetical protein
VCSISGPQLQLRVEVHVIEDERLAASPCIEKRIKLLSHERKKLKKEEQGQMPNAKLLS